MNRLETNPTESDYSFSTWEWIQIEKNPIGSDSLVLTWGMILIVSENFAFSSDFFYRKFTLTHPRLEITWRKYNATGDQANAFLVMPHHQASSTVSENYILVFFEFRSPRSVIAYLSSHDQTYTECLGQ